MDQLTKDCIAARSAGLTYGRYMATKPQKEPPVRFPKKAKAEEGLRCAHCGMYLPANCRRKKYCCEECAEEASIISQRARDQKTREQKALEKPQQTCIRCGKPIPVLQHRRKYCGAECADAALQEIKSLHQTNRAQRKAGSRK